MLVILVVFLFLRNVRATLIPAVAVPVSLIGTCAVMYLCGYSLDNLSLMALAIASGFVVDDAIVVMENITRHLEEGMTPMRGRALGRAGDRLHGLLHQHLADRRLHSAAADGRHHRASVPRVRHHAFRRDPGLDGGLADDHADDVLARSALRERHQARQALQLERADFQRAARRIRAQPDWVLDHPALLLVIFLGTLGLMSF